MRRSDQDDHLVARSEERHEIAWPPHAELSIVVRHQELVGVAEEHVGVLLLMDEVDVALLGLVGACVLDHDDVVGLIAEHHLDVARVHELESDHHRVVVHLRTRVGGLSRNGGGCHQNQQQR